MKTKTRWNGTESADAELLEQALKPTYRLYASSYAKGLHVIFDPLDALAHAVDRMCVDNKGVLIHAGTTILGKCSERFYTLPTAATARKLAKIMTGTYEVTA